MKIAIDYDKTWTADPEAFYEVAKTFSNFGHVVYVVTARSPTADAIYENLDTSAKILMDAESDGFVEDVIYCDGIAKKFWLYNFHKLEIDIWIDDKPQGILSNSTATWEILEEWRANGRT